MDNVESKVQVFVVEDHPNLRRLVSLFLNMQPDMECCGMADSAEKALEDLKHLAADVILVDLSLPKMNGLDLVVTLQRELPELICIILTAHDDPDFEETALKAGAKAYILKGSPTEMGNTVRRVWNERAK